MAARRKWQVRMSGPAARDFSSILSWTEGQFGARQALAYEALLRLALRSVARDPFAPQSRSRGNELGTGFRTLHMGRRGRHLLLYRIQNDDILVLRILHDSMDLSRHLPAEE